EGTFGFAAVPLTAGSHAVWVQAVDGAGNASNASAAANVSYQPVGLVGGLTAVATGSDVILNWNTPSGTATGFNVYRGQTRLLARVAGTTFSDRAPSGPQTYSVAAVNACGAAGPRATASVN